MRIFFLCIFFSGISFCQLDSILNNISTDSLLYTLKELTGAVPVNIEGKTDTIKTRVYLSSYNRIAAKYLKEKFESFGIETESINFFGYSPSGITVNFQSINKNTRSSVPYWVCTDWGEIFSSKNYPPVYVSRKLSGVPKNDRLDWIDFIGSDIIAAMGQNGNFAVSKDSGNTWKKDSTGFTNLKKFLITSNTLVAAGKDGIIYRSTDTGSSWSQVNINSDLEISDAVSSSAGKIFIAGKNKTSGAGLMYFSTDSGLNWTPAGYSFEHPLKSLTYADSVNIWAAGQSGVVYRTTNGGINWYTIYSPADTVTVKKIYFFDQLKGWILSTDNYIYKSFNSGLQWFLQTKVDTPSSISDIMFVDSLQGIIIGSEHSAILTNTGGNEWIDLTKPLAEAVIATIPGTTDPDKCIVLTAHYDCVINNLSPPYISGWINSSGADDDGSGTAALIELSRVIKKFPVQYTLKLGFVPDEELAHGGSYYMGQQMINSIDSIGFAIDLDMVGYDYLVPGYMTIFTNDHPDISRIYYNYIPLIQMHQLPLNVTQVKHTTVSNLSAFIFNYPNFGIAEGAGIGGAINPNYHDLTDTWNTLNPEYYTNVLKASALLAHYYSTGYLLDNTEDSLVVNNFKLYSAYPNPFNPQTIIRFTLPVRNFVSLKIFDILGREVKVLIQKEMEAGEYNVEFSAQNLSSGIYICSLETGGFSDSIKLVYVK